MKRIVAVSLWMVIALAATLHVNAQVAAPMRLASDQLAVEFDSSMRTRLIVTRDGRNVPLSGFEATELVTVAGREANDHVTASALRDVDDELGKGSTLEVTGESGDLEKTVSVTIYSDFANVAVIKTTWRNKGTSGVKLDRWIERRSLAAAGPRTPGFWSYEPGSYESRPDWVLPLKAGFAQQNFMGMNADDYGGGTPVVDVWRRDVGIGVGHLELEPQLVSLPVRASGRAATLGIEGAIDRTLAPGESFTTPRTFVTVHTGDYYRTLETYRAMMMRLGVRFPEIGAASYDPIWCGWGYDRTVTADEIYKTLPKAAELGFKWAVLDDGWQTAEGDWYLTPSKFPNGDRDMLALTKGIRDRGLRPMLWWSPLAVDPGTDLIRDHPDYLLINKDGKNQKISWWDAFYLCPSYPPVREYTERLVTRFLRDWDYDGLKIDGQHLNAAPPCYNPAHHHANPRESYEAVPEFFKLIYETAKRIKPDAVIEICPCGTGYAFHTMPYMNLAVASDPESSWQVRSKGKTIKALMGPSAPYFGDHVELSDGGDDFASTVGVGGVVGTQFTLAEAGKSDPKYHLTRNKEREWRKWVGIYSSLMLSKGEYRGDLYDIGFDRPEAHAIRKDNRMYYAFYAPRFDGRVELRGLGDRAYTVRDYVSGRDLGAVRGPRANLRVRFSRHLLLEATPAS